MMVQRYIAICMFGLYGAALALGVIPIVIISGAVTSIVCVLLWVIHRASVATRRHELFLIPLLAIGNVVLVFMTGMDLSFKLAYSLVISSVLVVDMIMFYKTVMKADQEPHL